MDAAKLPTLAELKRRGDALSRKVQANIAELQAICAVFRPRVRPRNDVEDGAWRMPWSLLSATPGKDAAGRAW